MKFSIEELSHVQMKSNSDESFSLSSVLSEKLGFNDLFIHHEILEPGKCASSPHRHTLSEEFVIVLAGSVVAHRGSGKVILNEGDFIGFHPNESELHFIENKSQDIAKFLVVKSNHRQDAVIY